MGYVILGFAGDIIKEPTASASEKGWICKKAWCGAEASDSKETRNRQLQRRKKVGFSKKAWCGAKASDSKKTWNRQLQRRLNVEVQKMHSKQKFTE